VVVVVVIVALVGGGDGSVSRYDSRGGDVSSGGRDGLGWWRVVVAMVMTVAGSDDGRSMWGVW